jgi:ATP-dependent exoDNAse (exonuclease V) beta subunit
MEPAAMNQHEIILASAGTGKTYTLSDRIVRLLALGATPESIVALTFTRKAAAEFVSAVFCKLAAAALDEEAARATGERLSLPQRRCAEFQAVLALVIARMDRLGFGTLDSFFQRIVGAIPFELGLAGSPEILDERAAADAQERVLRGLVRRDPRRAGAQRALLDAFRDATWGVEEKQLLPRLLAFVRDCHELYLAAPDASRWGREEAVWPNGCRWLPAPDSAEDALVIAAEWADSLDGRFGDAMRKLVDGIANWQPGVQIPGGALAERLVEIFAGDGPVPKTIELVYSRKAYPVPERATLALQCLVRAMIGGSLEHSLRAARGIYRILADFDAGYEREVRRSGRLSFADVNELLLRTHPGAWQERLDARLSHWLFDEFQDTDLAQWAALSWLIDEVLQDPTGERSVFFVGDPKQAIYRWRGGEHRLLAWLRHKYESVLAAGTLTASRRSAQPLVDFINYTGEEVLSQRSRLPEDVVEEWRDAWSSHSSAVDEPGAGHVEVREAADFDALVEGLHDALCEIDPIARGLSCAILTRTNTGAADIAHALRQRGWLDVSAEADISVATDNPVTRAVLALFAAAAHPMDAGSRALVEMSPLMHWVAGQGGWPDARIELLARVTRHGYERTLGELFADLGPHAPADEFSRRRIHQLLEAARKHDAEDGGGIDEFLRAANRDIRRDSAAAGRVQAMTIHKSKGLGFDVVLLSVDDRERMDVARGGVLLVGKNAVGRPEWVIRRPDAAVASADATLARALEIERCDSAYEGLCLLYVALTRAKRELRIFCGPPPSSDERLSPVGLVRAAASRAGAKEGLPWEHGLRDWFRSRIPRVESDTEPEVKVDWSSWARCERREPVRPSRLEIAPHRLTLGGDAKRAGVEIHAIFGAIEWMDDSAPCDEPSVRRCLENPRIAACFRAETVTDAVWRERAFDVWLDGEWISGVFDRVVLRRDRAVLLDFKTDACEPAALLERHGSQMRLYRRALARLVGWPEERIEACLVHVPTADVIAL